MPPTTSCGRPDRTPRPGPRSVGCQRARELAASALAETRIVAAKLRPTRVHEIGLGAALANLARSAGVAGRPAFRPGAAATRAARARARDRRLPDRPGGARQRGSPQPGAADLDRRAPRRRHRPTRRRRRRRRASTTSAREPRTRPRRDVRACQHPRRRGRGPLAAGRPGPASTSSSRSAAAASVRSPRSGRRSTRVADGADAGSPAPGLGPGRAARASIRVALVDDHHLIREGLRLVLQGEHGFEIVGEAADHASAIDLVVTQRPDVLVLDLTFPEGDAMPLLRTLRAREPGPARRRPDDAQRPRDGPPGARRGRRRLPHQGRPVARAGRGHPSGGAWRPVPAQQRHRRRGRGLDPLVRGRHDERARARGPEPAGLRPVSRRRSPARSTSASTPSAATSPTCRRSSASAA